MYIKKVHILIEQRLHNVGVFAYGDIQPEQIDLYINKILIQDINSLFNPANPKKPFFEQSQAILDKYQNLQIKDFLLNVIANGDVYYTNLPEDYVHLISDRSLVLIDCNTKHIELGTIETGEYYLVKGKKSINYNGQTYVTGSRFIGLEGQNSYSYTGVGDLLLVKLVKRKSNNRLIKSQDLDSVRNNALTKTSPESPVSNISENKLFVEVSGFFVDKLYISYVRKPKLVNIKFKTYNSTTPLVAGIKYETISDEVIYSGTSYTKHATFIASAGVSISSGTARIANDGDLELNDTAAYDLIDKIVTELAVDSEQPQQKIVNQIQANNV